MNKVPFDGALYVFLRRTCSVCLGSWRRVPLPVFLSFDRRPFCEEDYNTDWPRGKLCRSDTLTILADALRNREIIGIDLCGAETLSEARDNPPAADRNSVADRCRQLFYEKHLDTPPDP